MSTRAMYTFTDAGGDVHVYNHHDGYPYCKFPQGEGGGLVWINSAIKYAWELPRFEADDFAAAFVSANKQPRQGGVRLVNKMHPWEFAGDCEYWYKVKIAVPAFDVWVDVYSVDWWQSDNLQGKKIMSGALSELLASERAKREVA